MTYIHAQERIAAPRVLFTALAGVSLLLAMAPSALGGTIEGRLVVPAVTSAPQQATSSPYPGMEAVATSTGEARTATPIDAVIWIENIPNTGAIPLTRSPAPELRQVRYSFKPRVLGIPVGTTVEFPNDDAVFHNVFSYSKTKRFDLGYYGKGKSKQVTFDKPGVVKVFCDIHSHMSAFIVVTKSPFVASPGTDGRFVFENVPDGTWRIRTWHPDLGEVTRDIAVSGETTSVEIRY
jgi:plastocyanin